MLGVFEFRAQALGIRKKAKDLNPKPETLNPKPKTLAEGRMICSDIPAQSFVINPNSPYPKGPCIQ